MTRSSRRRLGLVVTTAAVAATVALSSTSAQAGRDDTVRVSSSADSGEGSFRAAIEAANGDPEIDRIVFRSGVDVLLESPVEYTGDQHLSLLGRDNVISGDPAAAAANPTFDGGLFVSRSGADLSMRRLTFAGSFNNGLAVFLPADAGDMTIEMNRVTVADSKFHGIFVDGQSTTGYNSDDVPHPGCTDPHPVDSAGSITIKLKNGAVIGNGTLAGGFDDSTATGCPRDFDGVRVDDGADGGIHAEFSRMAFDGNLADGVELDETGDGGVGAIVTRSTFDANGNSGETVDGLEDLDDGFDIDEVGPGDIWVSIARSSMSNNFDEGLDLDEAGEGSVDVQIHTVVADGNEDEGVKVDEEDDGDLSVGMGRTSSSNSLSQDGVDLTEEGDGNLWLVVDRSVIVGNDNNGIAAEQADAGEGGILVKRSDLTGNGEEPIDAEGIDDINVSRTAR